MKKHLQTRNVIEKLTFPPNSDTASVNWNPGSDPNGCNATFYVEIAYSSLMGEPLESCKSKAVKCDRIYYNGRQYSISDVGNNAYDLIDIGTHNTEADIYQGSTFITIVRFTNVRDFDQGSPDWSDLFPGLSAERAKQLYKEGFQIACFLTIK